MPTPDPLAVTVDASGRRWIRCARCVGSSTVWRVKGGKLPGIVISDDFEEVACPDCNGRGQVEVP